MATRLQELDAIRGIAALMVVMFHYSVHYTDLYGGSAAFSFVMGKHGVDLFFIVSGFVIFLTLDKTAHAADFIVSRMSRLYPAYWVAVILTFSVVSIFSLPGRELDLLSALINLTMIQKYLGYRSVDGVYWTLMVELAFYLIMFVIYVTGYMRRINFISVLWLLVIVLSYYFDKNEMMKIPGTVKLFLLLDYGNLFIAGMMFYKLKYSSGNMRFPIIIAIMSLCVEYYINSSAAYIVTVYYIVFAMFVTDRLSFVCNKPLLFLGAISYSLYLVHQNIGYVVIREMESYGFVNQYAMILVPLAVSIGLATLMRNFVEKPSLTYIRGAWMGGSLRKRLIRVC